MPMDFNCSMVLTTIHDPKLLEDYYTNFKHFGHLDRVKVYLIPDRKTPKEAYLRCEALRKKGLDVVCPDLQEQENFLAKLGSFSKLVPYDSDNRRNIGYLMAYESGYDFVISIDDDNYCQPDDDFLAEHSVVLRDLSSCDVIDTSIGWYNICELLELETTIPIYPRGFPYHKRHLKYDTTVQKNSCQVRMNAGLWLFEPDLDGITWLVAPAHAKSFVNVSYVLGPEAWSPINTQNTALHRDVIPSYYFLKMNYIVGGFPIDRYGDIFSGYFSQACIRHLGHAIRVGAPVAEHHRNTHNYLNDATNELACILVLEDLTEWLKEMKLEGNNYFDVYTSLSYLLEDAAECFSGSIWTESTRGYIHQIAYCMREWINACRLIGS